jgi:hypothetical protein
MLIQYQIPWMVHFPRSFFVFVPLQALRVICEKALFFNKKAFDKMRREKPEGWLPPTVEHKKDLHVSIVMQYLKVCPIVSITAEAGTFDTQLLEAIESGRPAPKGSDYQTGPRCRLNTLRDAVFFRDGYKCLLCGSTKGPSPCTTSVTGRATTLTGWRTSRRFVQQSATYRRTIRRTVPCGDGSRR